MTGNEIKKRVLIFGSCVSRDVFNVDSTRFKITDYFARCSFASLASTPLRTEDYDFSKIASTFQQRMVMRDFQKTPFFEVLRKQDFDVLLIDLIDERFDLYEIAPNAMVTVSSELNASGLIPKKSLAGYRGVESGSLTHRKLWIKGIERLFAELNALGIADRVVINKVFWADRLEDGTALPAPFSAPEIARANANLAWMYQQLERFVPAGQWMHFNESLLKGATAHQWGISAFHYPSAYYREALDTLNALTVAAQGVVRCEIDAVTVDLNEDMLTAEVVTGKLPGAQFAFYVFRDDIRLHTQWYTSDNLLIFDTEGIPGTYRVLAFLTMPGFDLVKKYSESVKADARQMA